MFSIGLTSTVAFPLVAFQGTLSHGSEISALAIVTCDDLEPTYVYEFAAAAATTAAAASAYNYISEIHPHATYHHALCLFRTNKAHDY